jgi:glycosyltransferase involved in cell wall biosynthesis
MRILHVIRDLTPATGGPVSAIKSLVDAQLKQGHEVVVVSTDYGLLPTDANILGPRYVICHCILGPWRYSPALAGALSIWVPWCDVMHVHMLWEYPTLVALRMARKMGKPFLLRPCGMLDVWSIAQRRLKKRLYLALFARTLFAPPCLLHFTTKAEQLKSPVLGNPDAVVIENGVSEQAFAEHSADGFLDIFPQLLDKRVVLFLGRIHPKKRPDIAIDAFARVARQFPDSVLVLAGPCSEAYRRELAALAESFNIGERTIFTGMLQGRALYGAYRAASIFLLPSMQENFGIAAVEAMAAACPVIISEHVDIRDYVEAGNAGMVCVVSPGAFAAAIVRLLGERQFAHALGNNGRKVAKKFFTWDRAAKKLDQVYRDLVR